MARRKKHTKKRTHSRRKRSIGAISSVKSALMQTAYGVAGAVAASYLKNAVTSAVDKVDSLKSYSETIGAASPVILGAFLPKLVKQKSEIITGIQQGMLIGGGLSLVKSLNILPGIGGIEDYYVPTVAGMTTDVRNMNVPAVAGMSHTQRYMGAASEC